MTIGAEEYLMRLKENIDKNIKALVLLFHIEYHKWGI